jgi:uncharacterized protein YeaO (DUF488 family)
MDVRLKRTVEAAEADDGLRLLVDRLWPRGVRKDALKLDAWLKDVAPSTELRKWFGHDPAKWEEFQQRYFAELDARPEVLEPLLAAVSQRRVTLLYSARDTEHNQAVALKRYLTIWGKEKKR